MSALNMGGEDSQDPLDNAVSAHEGWRDPGHSGLIRLRGHCGHCIVFKFKIHPCSQVVHVTKTSKDPNLVVDLTLIADLIVHALQHTNWL